MIDLVSIDDIPTKNVCGCRCGQGELIFSGCQPPSEYKNDVMSERSLGSPISENMYTNMLNRRFGHPSRVTSLMESPLPSLTSNVVSFLILVTVCVISMGVAIVITEGFLNTQSVLAVITPDLLKPQFSSFSFSRSFLSARSS